MATLSQFNEAEVVADYFGSYVGAFLDLGASNGVSLSNTFQLGLRDWHGLLVEASPLHFQNLLRNYFHRGGFQFLLAAVWHERRIMEFNYNAGWYSSLIHKDEPGLFESKFWIPTVIAADLKAIQPDAEFISIDLEGADILVFPSLMEVYHNCRLVVVEHANDEALKIKWQAMFHKYGLKVIATTPENYIGAKT